MCGLVAQDIQVLDLSKPWSNRDNSLWTSIPKPTSRDANPAPPTLNDGAMWADEGNLYIFGGALSTAPGIDPVRPPHETWRYNLERDKWTSDDFSGKSPQRIFFGASIQASDGTGYYLSGIVNWRTDPNFGSGGSYMVDGLVTFDPKTQRFGNESTTEMNPTGTLGRSYLVTIEGVGEKGILVALGGVVSQIGRDITYHPSDFGNPHSQVGACVLARGL